MALSFRLPYTYKMNNEAIEDELFFNVGFGIVLYTPCDVGYENGNRE